MSTEFSCSPQRPAVTKFKHRTDNDVLNGEKNTQSPDGPDTHRDERGANAELRIRNKNK